MIRELVSVWIQIKSPSLIKAAENLIMNLCQKKRQLKILLTPLSSYTMLKKTSFLIACCFIYLFGQTQEIQARLTMNVNKDKVPTTIDRKIFQTLQAGLTNFVNNRKWTNDVFQPSERIQCNFLLSINEVVGTNEYRATLTVQAARPAYNSTYQCPLINYMDETIVFKYVEFQPIEFNENRVQGNDPMVANLTAVFAYWVNIILGFDYDSFSLRGGDPYFIKAQNIVNNAPESSAISGWKNYENQRNRYWLAENINNNRFALIHDALYLYYRNGMDLLYENEEEARNGVLNCLNYLSTINKENPNSMIMQFFFQGRSNEFVKIFSKAKKDVKDRALNHLLKLDVTNARVYNDLK